MSILKDKFFGMTIASAIGDFMGTYVDLNQQEGKKDVISSPLSIPEEIRGYWTEMTSLMLCQFDCLINLKNFQESFANMIENNEFTSNGVISDLNLSSFEFKDQDNFKINDEEKSCNFSCNCNCNSDCLGLIAATNMYYYRNYEEGHLYAFNNKLAHCIICKDACKLYYSIVDLILHGYNKKQVLDLKNYANLNLNSKVSDILDLKDVHLYQLQGKDDVLSVLKMVIYCFNKTDNIKEGLTMVINNSKAPNRTGSVFGQIAGGYYGLTNINEDWLTCIKEKHLIVNPVNEILKILK